MLLFALTAATAGPVQWCANFESAQPSLLGDMGVPPSTLPGLDDDDVIAALTANGNDRLAQRISIARTRVWNTLAYKLDAFGHLTSGTWRHGPVTDPTSGYTFDVVHWADIDDDSWTLYFVGQNLCAVVYEN